MRMVDIDSLNSSGIEREMREQCITQIKFIGSFLPKERHPNVCDADARIWIYEFPNGYKVADTNGDPVWEACDPQAWGAMMQDFETGL